MTDARGDRAKYMSRRQADFKTAEAAGDGTFFQLPFHRLRVVPVEETSVDDKIVGDAYPGEVVAGLRNMRGDLEVPLGLSSIGWHLYGLFGAPATTNVGAVYTHVFTTSASPPVLHHTDCIHHTDLAANNFVGIGLTYLGFNISAQKNGTRQRMTLQMAGRERATSATPLDNTPVLFDPDRTPVGFQAKMTKGGADEFSITSFDARFANGVEPDQEALNGSPYAERMDDGKMALNGSLAARYRDGTWIDHGDNGDLIDVECEWRINDDNLIHFRYHNIRIEQTGIPVEGAGIISTTFNWTADRPDNGDTPLTITLKNGVTNYANL